MHRVQRFLRTLSDEQWRTFLRWAQTELGEKSLSLLLRLREARNALSLRGSDRVLAQRIERWLWRCLWRVRYTEYPIYLPPPVEWLYVAVEAYHAAGMHREALMLLHQIQKVDSMPLRALLMEARLRVELGDMKAAYQCYTRVDRWAEVLHQLAQVQRMQSLLSRVFQERGGSYTAPAQRLMRRMIRLRRWQAPLPDDPQLRSAEKNLRGTWALFRGELEEALHWYQPDTDFPAQLVLPFHLNRWLVLLYMEAPTEALVACMSAISAGDLPPFQKKVLLSRLLLTTLLRGSMRMMHEMANLLKAYPQSSVPAEVYLTLIQLRWLSGEKEAALSDLTSFLTRTPSANRSEIWQAHILRLLLSSESGRIREIIVSYREASAFLRKNAHYFASAPVMRRLIQKLYESRLSPRALSEAALAWEAHLRAYPAEALFWKQTILPVWIDARRSGNSLEHYVARRSTDRQILHLMQNMASSIQHGNCP